MDASEGLLSDNDARAFHLEVSPIKQKKVIEEILAHNDIKGIGLQRLSFNSK